MNGYSPAFLQNDLHTIRRTDRADALNNHRPSSQRSDRIPLVLTYHPLKERINRNLLRNFNILIGDPETRKVFQQPPLVTYRRDSNLRQQHPRAYFGQQPTQFSCGYIFMLTRSLPHLRTRFQRHQRPWPLTLFCNQEGVFLPNVWLGVASPFATAVQSTSAKQGVH